MDDIRIPKMECDYTLIKILIFKTSFIDLLAMINASHPLDIFIDYRPFG